MKTTCYVNVDMSEGYKRYRGNRLITDPNQLYSKEDLEVFWIIQPDGWNIPIGEAPAPYSFFELVVNPLFVVSVLEPSRVLTRRAFYYRPAEFKSFNDALEKILVDLKNEFIRSLKTGKNATREIAEVPKDYGIEVQFDEVQRKVIVTPVMISMNPLDGLRGRTDMEIGGQLISKHTRRHRDLQLSIQPGYEVLVNTLFENNTAVVDTFKGNCNILKATCVSEGVMDISDVTTGVSVRVGVHCKERWLWQARYITKNPDVPGEFTLFVDTEPATWKA